jgi:hypothetical protein
VFNEDSVHIPTQRSRIPSIHPDVPVNHLDACQLATFVLTMRTFRLDPHQCLEASNCSRLHPSGRNGKSSGRYLEFEKILEFQCIRLEDVVITSER